MDPLRDGQLESRLESLERRLRRAQFALYGVLLLGLVGLMAAWTSPDREVKAEQFIVVDKDGKEHARLGLVDSDECLLLFTDKNQKGRIAIGYTSKQGGSLTLCDELEHPRASLRIGEKGLPWFTFVDQDFTPIWTAPEMKPPDHK